MGRRPDGRGIRATRAAFFVLSAAATAQAQVVTAPNQLVGEVRWTNANEEILHYMRGSSDVPPGEGGGMFGATVHATSRPPQVPTLSHDTYESGPTSWRRAFELTVESGDPGSGISYEVGANVNAGFRRWYDFGKFPSAPVEKEPAPDVDVDVAECAALVDVQWAHLDDGSPAFINKGSMESRRPRPSDGHMLLQASASWTGPTSRERLLVRGDGTPTTLRIIFERGTDPFRDTSRLSITYELEPACDEVIPIRILVDRGGGICEDPPRIVGRFDVVGESEHLVDLDSSRMWAEDGPEENYRWDLLEGVPSSGRFELVNLMPSNFVVPERGYQVGGVACFRRGRSYQRLITPQLDDVNGRVFVYQRNDVDLGDTFVIRPGWVRGDILLSGPPALAGLGATSLEDVNVADPGDPDGIPDGMEPLVPTMLRFRHGLESCFVEARGTSTVAGGARWSSSGGEADAAYDATYDAATGRLTGSYELVLGGLASEPSIWDAGMLHVGVVDERTPEVPESYRYFGLDINDAAGRGLLVEAGRAVDLPLHACVSDVLVSYRAGHGTFRHPELFAFGRFVGVDFEGRAVDQSIQAWAMGTPRRSDPAGTSGLVSFALAQGSHVISPRVQEIDPSGGTSANELPDFELEVGCRQRIEVSTALRLVVDDLAACSLSPLHVTGRADGDVDVARIAWSVNGGPETVACAPCGPDPSFALDAALVPCENAIRVTALDVDGNSAAVTAFTQREGSPIALDGCDDVLVVAARGATSAVVTWPAPAAADGCSGTVPVTCVPPSGTELPLGETEITCLAEDACGSTGRCTFTATVVEHREPLVVDAGPGHAICPGESARLGGSPTSSGGMPPFAIAWSPSAGLDDPSNPEPSASPATTTTYTVTVTDAWGQVATDACTVTVLPPAPVAAFEVPPGPWCEDQPICFTNRTVGATSFEWAFGTATGDASADESPCFAFPRPGTHVVTLRVRNACGSDDVQQVVEIEPRPSADFTFDLGRAGCIGSEVSFFEAASADATSWLWDFGDGTTSTEPDPTHAFGRDGIHVVSLVACGTCGCSPPAYRAVEIAADCNTDCGANSNQLACGNAQVVAVGDTCTDADRTNTGSYPCAAGAHLSGPNRTYDLNFDEGANFLVRLVETLPEPNGYDLDLMILRACNPPDCVAWGDEAVVSDDRDPTNQDAWLLVDGRDGSCGPYRLEVLCLDPAATASCAPPSPAGPVVAADLDPCAIGGVSLAWTAPASWGADPAGGSCASGSFEIWRSPAAAPARWRHVGTSLVPSFVDRSVLPGAEHRWRVVAVNDCCAEPAAPTPEVAAADRFSDPLDVSAGADRAIACGEATVRLLGHASGGSDGGFDVRWEPADAVSDPGTLSPIASREGTYVLTVVDRESGCTATDEVIVVLEGGAAAEPSARDLRPSALPLRVERASGDLRLEWEDVAASEYRIFEGALSGLPGGYDHAAVLCRVTPSEARVTPAPGSRYYLVASAGCFDALSSLGRSSLGTERPAPTSCP